MHEQHMPIAPDNSPFDSWTVKVKSLWEKFSSQERFTKVSILFLLIMVLVTPVIIANRTGLLSHAGISLMDNCTPIPTGLTQDQIQQLSKDVNWCTKVAGTATNNLYVAPTGNDSNGGSQANPFATITKASQVATPGTVVHVLAGTYTGPITTSASGLAGSPITYTSDSKWGAHIVLNSTTQDTVWANNGSYVDIVGFDISGGGIVRTGIIQYGSYVRTIGNRVHDIPAPNCDKLGGAGIGHGDYSSHDKDEIGNVVYNIGTGSCAQAQGIYHATKGGHIYNNIVYNGSGIGISLWHAATDVVIANNLVFGNKTGGIEVGSGDAPGGVVARNVIVENNIVIDNLTWGIYEVGLVDNTNMYKNNIILRNAGGPFRLLKGIQSNNIFVDPLFVNYKIDGTGDYHLQPSSPAISAGVATSAPAADIDGKARDVMDIGPYAGSPMTITTSCNGSVSQVTFSWVPVAGATSYTVDWWGTVNGKYNEYQTGSIKTTSLAIPNASYIISQQSPKDGTGTTITTASGFPQEISMGVSVRQQTPVSGKYSNSKYFTTAKCVGATPTPTSPPTPTPTPVASSNVAPNASVSVSSTFPPIGSTTFDGAHVKDGSLTQEWASNHQLTPWVQLTWPSVHTISDIKLFDRPNTIDKIGAGVLTFSDGSTVGVGQLPDTGSAYDVKFTPKNGITWVKFQVTAGAGQNVGLLEFQVFGN